MSVITAPIVERRQIQVYFLAAPEDQAVCEDIIKHLRPIVRNSPVPIEVNSDFNIPAGMEKEKHKERLFEADIVLALISVDFIDNDDIYNRNQRVIEQYNNHETVMIPILVRNFMWRATPFVSLPVVPRNLQPLNNKQFWNSPDDAVTAVVDDIYASIEELARIQKETAQPAPVAPVDSPPPVTTKAETPAVQVEVVVATIESTPSEATAPTHPVEMESAPVLGNAEADIEPVQTVQAEPVPAVEIPVETAVPEPESIQAVELEPVVEAKIIPAVEVLEETVVAQAEPSPAADTSSKKSLFWAETTTPIAADWRKKYYTTVMLKRAGAILFDYFFAAFVSGFLLGLLGVVDPTMLTILTLIVFYVVMPIMEASKWQATIGKRIFKLQITDRDGERITFWRAVWRNIIRSVVVYAYTISIGLLLIPQYFRFVKTRKLFHDELSGTVIGERLTSTREAQVAVRAV